MITVFKCSKCQTDFGTVISHNNIYFCHKCYREELCTFCNPPRLHSECPGHDIMHSSKNRFLEDKEFMSLTPFEETDGE